MCVCVWPDAEASGRLGRTGSSILQCLCWDTQSNGTSQVLLLRYHGTAEGAQRQTHPTV